MALHPDLRESPCAPLRPGYRWFAADEALRASACERLVPPLVARLRTGVEAGGRVTVRSWHDDFRLAMHLHDDVRVTHDAGHLFLTYLHRSHSGERDPPDSLAGLSSQLREHQLAP